MRHARDDEIPDMSRPEDWLKLPPPSLGEPRVLVVIAVDVATYERFRSRGEDWQAEMAEVLRNSG
jgi:uncharacterized protein (DUF4415 family)